MRHVRQVIVACAVTFTLFVLIGCSSEIASLQKAAEQGDPDAQFRLGIEYCAGDAIHQGLTEGTRLIRLAAEQGNAAAQFDLGLKCRDGQGGVPQDSAEGIRWGRMAAHQGLAEAQYKLGLMLQLAHGVPEHPVRAQMWLILAADQGHELAKTHLPLSGAGLSVHVPGGLDEAHRLAREWKPVMRSAASDKGVDDSEPFRELAAHLAIAEK